MSFALRFGGHDYPLGLARFLIGRSESCQLCIEDPMASRSHAAVVVHNGRVEVEDLQSRNGVFVNEERVRASRTMAPGDVIRVGGTKITLLFRGEGVSIETLAQESLTPEGESFGILGDLAEKALALGQGDEASRILGRQLDKFLQKSEKESGLREELFQKCALYSLKLSSLTHKSLWLDYLFRLHEAQGRLMDVELVNELYSISAKLDKSNTQRLRSYLDALAPLTDGFAPGERFVHKRIEGLKGILA